MPSISTLDTTTLLVLALLLLSVLLLAFTLATLIHQRRAASRELRDLDAKLDDRLNDMEDALLRQSLEQREELLRSLQQLNDSVLRTVSAVTRSQGEQVNALIKQSYDNAQAFDQRQQSMQRITEESLRRLEARMQQSEERAARQLAQNDLRMETLRKSMDESARELREGNARQLEEMRKTVDEKLHETLEKRLGDSFTQISERLEQMYRSLGEMQNLANGVGDLKRMLGNVKSRGVWGEMQLGALLEQALTSAQYETNVEVVPASGERVEYAVRLPGRDAERPVYLAIDSKFPQEDYARLADASQGLDAQAVEAARKALLNAVRTEAKRIGKYISPPFTTDFAVMFLPLEGLYAEVMRDAGTVDAIQREQRVLIAGPSTLLALLNSLQMGFRTLAIERRSAEVWKLLGAVKTDFGSFAQTLQKTQEKLQQATDSIDTAFVRTRSIEKKLRRVEALDETETEKLLEDGETEDPPNV